MLIKELASTIEAYHNCVKHDNVEWRDRHLDRIRQLEQLLPSGSGVDAGTKVDVDVSTGDKIVLHTSFHHMNENGFYVGWTSHMVIVRPTFIGDMNFKITGPNRNDIKEYLGDLFYEALRQPVPKSEQA